MVTNDYDPRDRIRKTIGDLYWLIVIIIMYIVLVLCCSSCSTSKPVVLERTYHDTVHINNLRLDSVYMHDSIYFESIVKGDTIYRTKEITRWRDRVSIKHDTIYTVRENKADISVPVERKLSLWKQFAVPLISIVLMITSTVSLIWLIHRIK
ncbi:hypothetical protein [Prevotella sp.]|uniref:hypothetical protein n=1 Tax=Prevotella sp. TaxID=59823 RepID=UPI0027E38D4D|nr:hypothetical protein [Prevotella sp.]